MDEQNPVNVDKSSSGRTVLLNLDYRWACMACYVPLVFVNIIAPVALLATEPKSNKMVRFHAIQGLCLAAAAFALATVNWFIMYFLHFVLGPMAFSMMGLNSGIIWLVVLVVSIYGVYCLYKGRDFRLPIIGDFAGSRA